MHTGSLHLTAILDLANRKLVEWTLSGTVKAENTSVAAFKMALKWYQIKNRTISMLRRHSLTGVGNTCETSSISSCLAYYPEYELEKVVAGTIHEMRAFFKTLNPEMAYHQEFKSKQEAKLAISEFIEVWRPLRYNIKRIHSSPGYFSRQAFEETILNEKKAALRPKS